MAYKAYRASLVGDSGVSSNDKTLMEKVKLMDSLEDEEKKTIFNMLDAFASKRKLRDALTNALDFT